MDYKELIKRLRELQEVYAECDYSCGECLKNGQCVKYDDDVLQKICVQAAAAIEELSRENESLAKSVNEASDILRRRWIPVTERLPNCNGCYLVWRPHFFGGEIGMPSICYFDGSNTWHDSYGVDFERILHPDDVTHWMPLPEPPKEAQ